jgi:hypothetical protein
MKLLERVAELEGENRRLLSEYAAAKAEAVRRVDRLAAVPVDAAKTTPALWVAIALLVALTSMATTFVTSRLVDRFVPRLEETW